MELTVVLVNYKCDKNKLQTCLNSIKINTKVIVVDHSHDFTLTNISVPKNLNIEIIKNENLGNGAGINCGLKNSKTRYVLYLDIDTILPDIFFKTLEESVLKIKDFAIISPKIHNFYKTIYLNYSGNLSFIKFLYNKFFFNLKLDRSKIENIKHVFFVSGSIMFIDKQNTFDVGIKFDENIFLFFEEDEFFHQCFKSNKKIYLIENLYANHLDGSISNAGINYERFKKWHWEWSKCYFLNKHYNSFLIFLISMKNITKYSIKIIFFLFFNNYKYQLFKARLNGVIGFYLNKKCKIKF